MKKATSKIPFFCFVLMLIVLYFDNNRYSNQTLILVLSLLLISIVSFINTIIIDKKENNLNRTKLYLVIGGVIASIGIALFYFFQN
ncbi:hypothetical protein [Flavobacterium limnosediminis]|uniref:hypothetical protein n=1 Tax=Flavobacterium limnosediminis TaxID=1401027 RepID=UPI0012DD1BC9|nr:hypothetical protein [Flavobacterium limnosediminis]